MRVSAAVLPSITGVLALVLAFLPGAVSAGLACEREYVVQEGDTLGQIAIDFGVEEDDILACNPDLDDPDLIFPGQVLAIPGAGEGPVSPGEVNILTVVDKEHSLPSSYVPPDLVAVNADHLAPGIGPQQLQAEANHWLGQMVDAAAGDGHMLGVTSAYRSYEEQAATFQFWVDQVGLEEAERISARAGHSEHQLGTTADISGASVNYQLTEALASAPEGQWLMNHAHEYGFALSYPEDGEPVTGYIFEPWHWRYIGVPFSSLWEESGLVLVQFLERLLVWGDVNCSGAVDPTDSLAVLRGDAGLFYQRAEGCPELTDAVSLASGQDAAWGDIECGSAVSPVDALMILRADAGLSVSQEEGCAEIGSKIPALHE